MELLYLDLTLDIVHWAYGMVWYGISPTGRRGQLSQGSGCLRDTMFPEAAETVDSIRNQPPACQRQLNYGRESTARKAPTRKKTGQTRGTPCFIHADQSGQFYFDLCLRQPASLFGPPCTPAEANFAIPLQYHPTEHNICVFNEPVLHLKCTTVT